MRSHFNMIRTTAVRSRMVPLILCLCYLLSTPVLYGFGKNGNQGLGGIRINSFFNDERTFYSTENGLPDNDTQAVTVTQKGTVYAGTKKGLAQLKDGKFLLIPGVTSSITQLVSSGEDVYFSNGNEVSQLEKGQVSKLFAFSDLGNDKNSVYSLKFDQKLGLLIGTSHGLFQWNGTELISGLNHDSHLRSNPIHDISVSSAGEIALGTDRGLITISPDKKFRVIYPSDKNYSWSLKNVRGVSYDSKGRLWFASQHGVGVREGKNWTIYTGKEGLPYDDLTALVTTGDGMVWFGTKIGAIRLENKRWHFRQGLRWLPADHVRDIAVGNSGDAWFATEKGIGVIRRRKLTLSEKAKYFEDEIDRHHRRTPYGYVLEATLTNPGDKSKSTRHDSDNDGLWTSMYGAAECFAYAATKDPKAKERANKVMKAIGFLSEVTQGGEHPAPYGFPARTILPVSGRNPNDHDNRAHDEKRRKEEDPLWKVLVPRWPVSADGKWYWKTDTSSDELDGHYFFYGLYHDLVAETPQEKEYIKKVTARVTDHLIKHNFSLVDHDGKPTRWARFGPKELNTGLEYAPGLRGLNSIALLSYIKVAFHVTGDQKYQDAYMHLIKDHQYDTNTHYPKWQVGPGTGNQSDDEMAFMCFYGLFNYETDPILRKHFLYGFVPYWKLEEPELCPLFNYSFAACFDGLDIIKMKTPQSCLDDALSTLVDFPLDRIHWGYKNSHRNDLVKLWVAFPRFANWKHPRGHKPEGKVIPINERFVNHWNNENWRLDDGGNPKNLSCGTSFLLPYYMGLYHGFIIDESINKKK